MIHSALDDAALIALATARNQAGLRTGELPDVKINTKALRFARTRLIEARSRVHDKRPPGTPVTETDAFGVGLE